MPDATRRERLDEFFRRLGAAMAPSNHDESLELVTVILNQVEDELTSIPFDPPSFMHDGRLYPPRPDSSRPVPGRPDLARYRSRGHSTIIGANGAIQIRIGHSGLIAVDKAGADGQGIESRANP